MQVLYPSENCSYLSDVRSALSIERSGLPMRLFSSTPLLFKLRHGGLESFDRNLLDTTNGLRSMGDVDPEAASIENCS